MGIDGVRALVNWHGEWVEATSSKTLNKGNDEEYPTFELADGSIISVHVSQVKDIPES